MTLPSRFLIFAAGVLLQASLTVSAAAPGGGVRTEQISSQPKVVSTNADDAYWDDNFPATADNDVLATAVDGQGNLYVGGSFEHIGKVRAAYIAKWDGTSWSSLGSGLSGSVSAIAIAGGYVYAGGAFTTAGGIAASGIARWDGASWAPLGAGVSGGAVSALATIGNDLYAAGSFTIAGAAPANRIARWNGSTWSSLGSGLNVMANALVTSGTELYVGGHFFEAGGVYAPSIAKWKDATWSGVNNTGMVGTVYALAMHDNALYAGGEQGNTNKVLHKWDGSSWSAVSGLQSTRVHCLAAREGNLFVGGIFTSAGGIIPGTTGMAGWNGTSWFSVGGGMGGFTATDYEVRALAASPTRLYAGGTFIKAGSVFAHHVAQWDGTSWSNMQAGFSDQLSCLAVKGDDVYCGGSFTGVGDVTANCIAKWNGSSWASLGSGMSHPSYTYAPVYAVAADQNSVYAGGLFTHAGETTVSNIAKWNGTEWSALGPGMNERVYAIATDGEKVYVGGAFTAAGSTVLNRIAMWNGSVWSPLGSGMDGAVSNIAICGGNLYASGSFTTAGGISAKTIAKWNGTAWSALPLNVNENVQTITASGSDLWAATYDPYSWYIARWNGTAWSPKIGGINTNINTIVASGNSIYIGGRFSTVGAVSAKCIAEWNGTSWAALGSGTDNEYGLGWVSDMAMRGDTLLVAGLFSYAGDKVSGKYGEWQAKVSNATDLLTTQPGAWTLGNSASSFYKPALRTTSSTVVSYPGTLPTTITLTRAEEIKVTSKQVRGAFTLSPGGVTFTAGATIDVEFSEDDAVLFNKPYTQFRAARLTYPAAYPASKEAASVTFLGGQSPPVPVRLENGRQIYSITAPITGINSTYGAIPDPATTVDNWNSY
ncbi:MAG: hypothetical protein ACR2IE_12960 [Candidatus Sumerlaeaceae bacterium]